MESWVITRENPTMQSMGWNWYFSFCKLFNWAVRQCDHMLVVWYWQSDNRSGNWEFLLSRNMESLFVLSDEKGNDEPKIGGEMNIVPDQLICGLMVKAPDYYLWGLQVRVLSSIDQWNEHFTFTHLVCSLRILVLLKIRHQSRQALWGMQVRILPYQDNFSF